MAEPKPLVLRAENAFSGVVVFSAVTVDHDETIRQLCKRLSKGLPAGSEYQIVSQDGSTPMSNWLKAFKNLKDMPCLRLLCRNTANPLQCDVCKAKLPGKAYRSRATGAVVCPDHFAQIPSEKQHFFQRLERPPTFKSSSKCETCRTKIWGDCYYVTPHGKVYCEQHVQQFGSEGVKLCRRVDAAAMRAWKEATRGCKRLTGWYYVDDGVHALKQTNNP